MVVVFFPLIAATGSRSCHCFIDEYDEKFVVLRCVMSRRVLRRLVYCISS